MASITMEPIAFEQFAAATGAMRIAIEKNVRMALVSGANDIHRTMVGSIQGGTKTGVVYKRGNKTHRASAPGEAPATDTGRLVSSINIFPQLQRFLIEIGVKQPMVEYAAYLEFGTSRMEPRPFIAPAYIVNRDGVRRKMSAAVKAGVMRYGN